MTTAISDLFGSVKSAIQNTIGAAALRLHISGQPVPASRPRVGKYGTYYSKNYASWIKESWPSVASFKGVPSDKPVAVLIDCVLERPKSSKLAYPNPDIDNFAKAPLDQITKLVKETGQGVWEDDKQVVFLSVAKRWSSGPDDQPGFHVYYTFLED